MSLSAVWLLVSIDVLAMGTAALFFIVACWCCFIASDFAEASYASGASAAVPGAGPEVEPSALGGIRLSSSAGGWVTGSSAPIPGADQTERETPASRAPLPVSDLSGAAGDSTPR